MKGLVIIVGAVAFSLGLVLGEGRKPRAAESVTVDPALIRPGDKFEVYTVEGDEEGHPRSVKHDLTVARVGRDKSVYPGPDEKLWLICLPSQEEVYLFERKD